MSNYGWTNSDGEPIMDGAAYRFEQSLDADYADQRYLDDDYADYSDESYPDEWTAQDENDDYAMDPFVMEDQWLDGSYEE